VDRILDMSRTTVNVIGDLCATTWVAKSEGVWSAASVPATMAMERSAGVDESPNEVLVTDRELAKGPAAAHDPSVH
jgi:Na+/H+-dicarboxylate symporter